MKTSLDELHDSPDVSQTRTSSMDFFVPTWSRPSSSSRSFVLSDGREAPLALPGKTSKLRPRQRLRPLQALAFFGPCKGLQALAFWSSPSFGHCRKVEEVAGGGFLQPKLRPLQDNCRHWLPGTLQSCGHGKGSEHCSGFLERFGASTTAKSARGVQKQ